MEFIKDLITYDFLRYSFISTFLVSLLTALVSPIIVYKKMEFVGDGLAHAIFAGVALAVVMHFNIFIGAILATLFFSFLIYYLNQASKMAESTVIGMLLPVFMSIGVVLFSKTQRYTTDVMSYLFGNVLLISINDLYFLLSISIVAIIVVFSRIYEISYWISDEMMAQFYGINIKTLKLTVLSVISLTVVASLKISGVILMGAFLVLPGIFAKKKAISLKNAILRAFGFNIFTSTLGFVIAYYTNTPPGPSIVLTSFIILIISWLI
ncbi:MAG: metal ABC transporter permease [Fervidobacterium sp.]